MDILFRGRARAVVLGLRAEVWRDALLAWAVQRAVVVALLVLVRSFIVPCAGGLSLQCLSAPWLRYDGLWYASIAAHGYTTLPAAAFSPLLPILERVGAPLAGGNPEIAGILLAAGAELVGLALLRELLAGDVGPATARRTLYVLVLSPMGLFFLMPYAESLFLALSVGVFLAARRRYWVLSGALASLASLTRQVGVLLVIPIAIEAGREWRAGLHGTWPRERGRVIVALVAPLLTLTLWQWLLDLHFHVADAIGQAAASPQWQRFTSWPWDGVLRDVATLIHGVSAGGVVGILRDLSFAALWLGIALAMTISARDWPLDYIAYTWASLAIVLLLPMHADPTDALNSLPRYMLVVFPCFVALAKWSLRSRVTMQALAVAFGLLQVAAIAVVCSGGFLA